MSWTMLGLEKARCLENHPFSGSLGYVESYVGLLGPGKLENPSLCVSYLWFLGQGGWLCYPKKNILLAWDMRAARSKARCLENSPLCVLLAKHFAAALKLLPLFEPFEAICHGLCWTPRCLENHPFFFKHLFKRFFMFFSVAWPPLWLSRSLACAPLFSKVQGRDVRPPLWGETATPESTSADSGLRPRARAGIAQTRRAAGRQSNTTPDPATVSYVQVDIELSNVW